MPRELRARVFDQDGNLDGTIGSVLDWIGFYYDMMTEIQIWISAGKAAELHPAVFLWLKWLFSLGSYLTVSIDIEYA